MTQHQENELAREWREGVRNDLAAIIKDVNEIKTDLATHKVKTGLLAMLISALVSFVAWITTHGK